MKKDYILVKINDDLVGTVEIHINDKVAVRDIINYEIQNFNFRGHKRRITEAVKTSKIVREYQIKNNLEIFNTMCVVLNEK